MSNGDPIFLAMCKQFGLAIPVCEYQFSKRKFRFDYAWQVSKVALEVEGGIWTRGRHTRGKGFLEDICKYNKAVVLNWRVLRCTPETLRTMATIELIRECLNK